MSKEQRFKTWSVLDCGLEKSSTGFNYWETNALTHELVLQGKTVRIFSHRAAPSGELFPGAEIIPTFSMSLYASISNDPTWSAIENFVVHNRMFHRDLAGLDPTLIRGSLAWFPMVGTKQLLGLFRWLAALPQELRPQAAINLFEPTGEWAETNPSARSYKILWEGCPPDVKKNVAIFARTPVAAAMFRTRLGIPSTVFPYALPERHLAPKADAGRTAQEPMIVSFVGGARRERGCALIADVVKRCDGMGVQFTIQVRSGLDRGFDAGVLTALAALPYVRIEQGAMERADYYRAIGESVVLLPYRPDDYRWRASGVYHEAKLLDAPVLVTDGTWMADEVRSLGNGLVIENFSTAAVLECIVRAQRELPTLKAAAARVGKEARKEDGVIHCIAAIEGAFARHDEVS